MYVFARGFCIISYCSARVAEGGVPYTNNLLNFVKRF